MEKGTLNELKEKGINLNDFSTKYFNKDQSDDDNNNSYTKITETNQLCKAKESNFQLEYQENQIFGKFSWNTYVSYFKSLFGYLGMVLILMFFVLAKLLTILTDYHVSEW